MTSGGELIHSRMGRAISVPTAIRSTPDNSDTIITVETERRTPAASRLPR